MNATRRPRASLNPPGPGVVHKGVKVIEVRLSGDLPGLAGVVRILRDAADLEDFGISEPSVPYPNRREPGHRVYVTLRLPAGETTDSDAGRRTAAKLSAAPLPSRQGGTSQ